MFLGAFYISDLPPAWVQRIAGAGGGAPREGACFRPPPPEPPPYSRGAFPLRQGVPNLGAKVVAGLK